MRNSKHEQLGFGQDIIDSAIAGLHSAGVLAAMAKAKPPSTRLRSRKDQPEKIHYAKFLGVERSTGVRESETDPERLKNAVVAVCAEIADEKYGNRQVKRTPIRQMFEDACEHHGWSDETRRNLAPSQAKKYVWLKYAVVYFGDAALVAFLKGSKGFMDYLMGLKTTDHAGREIGRIKHTNSAHLAARIAKTTIKEINEFSLRNDGDWFMVDLIKAGRPKRRKVNLSRDEVARMLWTCIKGWIWNPVTETWATELVQDETGAWVTRRKRLPEAIRRELKHLARFILVAIYSGVRKGRNLDLGWAETEDRGWAQVTASGRAVLHRSGSQLDHDRKPASSTRVLGRLATHLERWRRVDLGLEAGLGDAPADACLSACGEMSEHAFDDNWKICRSAAGLGDNVTCHVLKHFAISQMLRAGISLPMVSYLADTHLRTIIEVYAQAIAASEAEKAILPHAFKSNPPRKKAAAVKLVVSNEKPRRKSAEVRKLILASREAA